MWSAFERKELGVNMFSFTSLDQSVHANFFHSLSTQRLFPHRLHSKTPVPSTSHYHSHHSMDQDTVEGQETLDKQHHNGGSLPTPPGSTPLSPQKMMTSGIPSMLDQLPLPSTFKSIVHGVIAAKFWRTLIIHTEDYEEHDVYDDCEHYEGSEHTMRIMSLSVSDTDDNADDCQRAPYIDTAKSFGNADDSFESQQSQHWRQLNVPSSQQQKAALNSTPPQQGMSECSCHPSSSGDSTEEGKKLAESQQISPSKPTDVDNDGDLCCPSSSVITLDACIRNFIQFTSCSVIEALEAVTLHPAVLLGIQESKGVIKPGADADLVFLSDDLYVKRVFVAGEEVDLGAIQV